MYRVLKDGGFAVSFYGWNKVDLFMEAWRAAGFRIVGHLVFRKRYASSSRFLRYEHEQAYLLAKGNPQMPARVIPDVIDFPYSGNRLHPTQKPVEALRPLVEAFSRPGELVLDPFSGSGSTLAAAQALGRDWSGSNWTTATITPRPAGWRMRVESADNPRAVSRKGAIGLMQVMPATWASLRRPRPAAPSAWCGRCRRARPSRAASAPAVRLIPRRPPSARQLGPCRRACQAGGGAARGRTGRTGRVARAKPNLSRTLKAMIAHGIVRMERSGRKLAPKVIPDRVVLALELIPTSDKQGERP